ncbi:MAG: hypothetical protein J6X88_05460 [Bacteroidales bacterium]|nr:hypothetical protein [Bacteroidales bacterium]
MRKPVDSKHPCDAMKIHSTKGVFFDTFSSKNDDGRSCINNCGQGYSIDFSCCPFTGKEKDEETGYGYFGARYMDHELMTMWLSVDPLADKYPSISPYSYCAWNPVKLVDPDGRDVWEVDKNGRITNVGSDGGCKTQTIKYANGQTASFTGEYYHSILSYLTNTNSYGVSLHNGENDEGGAMADVFFSMAMNTDVEWRMDYKKDKSFILSSKHDESFSPSALSLGLSFKELYSTIHSHPNAENDYTNETESMGIVPQKGYYGGDYGLRNSQPRDLKSYVFMRNSRRVWHLRPNDNPGRVGRSNGDDVYFSSGKQFLQLLML